MNGLLHASVAVGVANEGVAGQLIVDGAGKEEITGAVLSCTVTVCTAVATLPHPSVAVQVRLTIYSAGQSPGTMTSLELSVKANPQASDAETEKDGKPGQLIVLSGGNNKITGGVTSCTWITCAAVELLPQASVAVHVRVVVYVPWQLPATVWSAKVRVKLLPQASVAVAVAKDGVAGQLMTEGAGKGLITGAVTSCTVMTWDAVELLPQASVAVHVRVLVYDPAQAPWTV